MRSSFREPVLADVLLLAEPRVKIRRRLPGEVIAFPVSFIQRGFDQSRWYRARSVQ